MAVDYFNNSSNDYINPALPVCPGAADGDASFEFIPKRSLGVVSGSDILASIDFSDFSQAVTAWTKERKTIQSGEVVFIQGLTKGISYKTEVFPYENPSTGVAEYYMQADVSLSYYKNFKFTTIDLSVNAIFAEEIDIANAFNIALDDLSIPITVELDASGFTFVGSNLGYEYNITNFNLTLDASTTILTQDASQLISAAKYPNTGMLGYVLKVTYPSTSTDEAYQYIKLNHVRNYLTYYTAQDVSVFGIQATWEPSTYWDISTGGSQIDVSVFLTYATYDVSSYFISNYCSVDVGMSGGSCIADEVMSAGDYLNYVEVNGLWDKIGKLRVWLAAPDPENNSSTTNLITGFYLYNPQTFPVMVEYMTLV